jgi:hypothetical protein
VSQDMADPPLLEMRACRRARLVITAVLVEARSIGRVPAAYGVASLLIYELQPS